MCTFSPKVFIPLTMLCRDRCGYCTFAKPPARLAAAYLTADEVLAIARAGAAAGCHEALFTLGERPELRYPGAAAWLAEHGFASTVDYLAECCRLVGSETGLLAHANAGALFEDELAQLRTVTVSQGMMLESLAETLDCHRNSPDKTPARRLATLEAAGRLKIAFTTGILVGIGETRADRLAALEAIAASHARHGHVQEVIVQNFLPKARTAMHAAPPCPPEEHLWSIAAARIVLPPDVHVQAPPNLTEDFSTLLDAGIDDWGGVSPVTADHVNPERAWPALDRLREVTEQHGHVLAPRLAVHPEWAGGGFVAEELRFAVLDHSDAEGLARDSVWCSGSDVPPPRLLAIDPAGRPVAVAPAGDRGSGASSTARVRHRTAGAVGDVLGGVLMGDEVGEHEIVTLFAARGPEVVAVAEVADELRREAVGDAVTYVANRNINYTNVCTFKCKFCAFSKGPLSLNLRGSPYLLEIDEITRRVVEAEASGATEVCLQGGIHPSFDGDYYLEVLKAVRAGSERIHIHAFTALEVHEGARRLGVPLEDYLVPTPGCRLAHAAGHGGRDPGRRSPRGPLPGQGQHRGVARSPPRRAPGRAAVERDDHVRRDRAAPPLGPAHPAHPGPATRDRGIHRVRPTPLRAHGVADLPAAQVAPRGPTFREALLMHAVGRIAYRGAIHNIQASWVKMGIEGAQQLLVAGCQ